MFDQAIWAPPSSTDVAARPGDGSAGSQNAPAASTHPVGSSSTR